MRSDLAFFFFSQKSILIKFVKHLMKIIYNNKKPIHIYIYDDDEYDTLKQNKKTSTCK